MYILGVFVEWRKDGLKLTHGLISSSDPLTLTLLEVEAFHVGLYECVSISSSDDTSTSEIPAASVYLYVNGPVMIAPPRKTRYVHVVAEEKETLIPCRLSTIYQKLRNQSVITYNLQKL